MPSFIACYDLKETNPSPHTKFLEKALANKWFLWIRASNGKAYRLPNTTLIGIFATRDAAVAALEKTRADTQAELGRTVTMPKWIVALYDGAQFDSDEMSA